MKLIEYRDSGMHTYTYFYVDDKDHPCSPFFDTAREAENWLKTQWDGWKPSRDLS